MAESKARAEKARKLKKLITELKDLYLREDTETAAKGLYHRALSAIYHLGGNIDKDTAQFTRIRDIILEIEKTI